MTDCQIAYSMLILPCLLFILFIYFFLHRISKATFVCSDFNDTEVGGVSKLPLLLNTTNARAEEHWTVIAVWL